MSTTFETNIIDRRYVITLTKFFNGSATFTNQLYVPFIPDEMIVRDYSYHHDGTEQGISVIYTDLVNDIICPISDTSSGYSGKHYLIQKPINSLYNFQVRTVSGAFDATRAGDFMISLEFVKYKDLKLAKIY